MPLIIGGLGTAAIAGGVSAWGAHKQAQAAKDAEAQQAALAQQAMDTSAEAGRMGAIGIGEGTGVAGQYLGQYGAQGIGELQQGRDMALGQLLGYGGQAESALAGGYGKAEGALGGGYENAINAYQQGMAGSNAYNNMMANPGQYMAQDPGYQFRQQQGEQAINRMASARGGRFSGRAAQELSNFNQGLASQEFGAAAQRAQQQDAMNMNKAQGLAGMYGAQGAGMASLYGQEGTGMAGFYGQQGQNLANLFTGTGSQLASAYGGLGSQLASNYNQGAVNQANALAGAAGQSGNIAQTMIPQYQVAPQYTGGVQGAAANTLSNLGNLALTAGFKNWGGPGNPPVPDPNANVPGTESV